MPDYKSHSMHSELVLPNINKQINIDRNDLRKFAIGPDSLMLSDYRLFDYQHSHNTKAYFETLIKTIKERKLQDNNKVMAFLYGQLDHFVLDLVMHPLIYYMTEKMPSNSLLKPHTLIEMWIADYLMIKYRRKEKRYYYKSESFDNDLKSLIDYVYKKVFNRNNVSFKYRAGINHMVGIDSIRLNKNKLFHKICERIKTGDFFYSEKISRVVVFLNLNHSSLQNPITGEVFNESFDDLWKESLTVASELIEEVNNFLYLDYALNSYLIRNDISYNTGLPCVETEEFKYVKKY
jgi:hypothetical protein